MVLRWQSKRIITRRRHGIAISTKMWNLLPASPSFSSSRRARLNLGALVSGEDTKRKEPRKHHYTHVHEAPQTKANATPFPQTAMTLSHDTISAPTSTTTSNTIYNNNNNQNDERNTGVKRTRLTAYLLQGSEKGGGFQTYDVASLGD